MQTIKEKLSKKYGYLPSDYEVISLYQQGYLKLSNREENEILNRIDTMQMLGEL